jgi:hypothetical protein
MTIKLIEIWEQAKDLTFGEARELLLATEIAAEDKLIEIRRRKNKAQNPSGHLVRATRMAIGLPVAA